jgi:glycosyltransferase involved in cell wall biosynthesis
VRIALATDWFAPRNGGIELHLGDLAARLSDAGHEVTVVTSTPAGQCGERHHEGGITIRRLSAARLPGVEVAISPGVYREIDSLLERDRPDLLHAHMSIVSPVAYCSALAARRRGIPTVATFHSVIRGLRPMLRALDAATRFSRRGAVVTAVSSTVARAVAPLSRSDAPVPVLPNGIEAGDWRVEATPGDRRTLRLVSAMRLRTKKRPAALLRAVREARRRLAPGIAVTLKLAGEGPERRALERLIARWDLGDSVTLLGHVSRPRLRELYGQADLFVLPTRLEAFGLAALEARAAGLPVAAMAGSGVADFVRDGREGWLAGSDAELAEILVRAAVDRQELKRIAAHLLTVRPPHDWSEVLPAHLEQYARAGAARQPVPAAGT